MKPIVFFCLCLPLFFRAQPADSVLSRIRLIKNDTEQINRLYQRGYALRNSDLALAYRYARLCEQKALENHFPKFVGKSYNLLGILFYKKGDFRKALRYHREALALRKVCADRLGQAHSLTNLGNVYNDLGLYAQAEQNYLEAMAIYQDLKAPDMVAASLLNLGTLRQLQKQMEPAKEYYLLAMRQGEQQNDYGLRTMCLNNLADLCYAEGDYGRAVSYNMDALKLADLMEDLWEKADAYLNLGACYLKMHNVEAARASIDTALKIGAQEDFFEVRYEACRINADYLAQTGNYKDAYNWQARYLQLTDSLQQEKELERNRQGFDEISDFGVTSRSEWNNRWLLILVLAMVVAVPVFLMRYKR